MIDKIALPTSVPTITVDGAIICDLFFFIQRYPDVAQRTLFCKKSLHWQKDSCNRAVVVYVPANVSSEKIIDLNQLLKQYGGLLLLEHVFIIAEGGSTLTLFDHTCNASDATVRSITGWIAENARVTLVRDQQVQKRNTDISTNVFYVDSNATLELFFLTTGSGFSKTSLDLYARAPGARIKVRGACVLHGNGVGECTVQQHHKAPHTTSSVNIKNVVRDSAQALYHGTIHIDRDAAHTDAVQENKNLLLGLSARAYSLPEIEALNHDVRCAHGSAVGKLDEEQLFYVQTRGLHKKQAQRMLVEGFLCDLFLDLNKGLRKMLQARILDAIFQKKHEKNKESNEKESVFTCDQ